jgi:predicted negative regulator of RcsB-dependent stress response
MEPTITPQNSPIEEHLALKLLIAFLIIATAGIAGWYIFADNQTTETAYPVVSTPPAAVTPQAAAPSADATIDAIKQQKSGDELSDINADIKSTNLNALDMNAL